MLFSRSSDTRQPLDMLSPISHARPKTLQLKVDIKACYELTLQMGDALPYAAPGSGLR